MLIVWFQSQNYKVYLKSTGIVNKALKKEKREMNKSCKKAFELSFWLLQVKLHMKCFQTGLKFCKEPKWIRHPIILAPYKILSTFGRSNASYLGLCLTVN